MLDDLQIELSVRRIHIGLCVGIHIRAHAYIHIIHTCKSVPLLHPLTQMHVCEDLNPQRLATAKTLGATHVVLNDKGDAAQQVMAATDGKGADFVVECVGTPTGWDICQNIVAFGGQMSILGCAWQTGHTQLTEAVGP